MNRLVAIAAAAAVGLGLQGCGDKPQSAGTRKADTQPYSVATGTHTAAGWKAGDAAGWESQMATRTRNGQNEYTRTGPR